VAAFDAAQQISGVRWNLTMGLYWISPTAFPTLDGRSREFNQQHFGIGASLDGAGYLAVRDQLLQRMAAGDTSITSFPLLSYAAWSDSTAVWPGHTLEGFAAWGARVAESVDLDEIEHNYKRATAEMLATTKQQIEAGDPAWTETFRQAMNSTNTIDFRFKSDLRGAAAADPDAVADLLQQVWSDPRPTALDGLREGLAVVLGGNVTPGNATALGATLLTAVDAEGNAPYSTTRVEKWRRLSGTEPLGWTESPSRRYADMLAFLDALAGQLQRQSGERPTILEAQGIAWATTENEIPAEWSESERKALQSWRADTAPEPPRAWLVRAKQADIDVWLDDGYVALAATNLPDVAAGADEKTVRAAVESGYQHVDYAQRQTLAAEYYAFLTRMKPGDLVAVPHDTIVHVGVVDGEPRYVDGPGDRLRRNVAWRAETEPGEEGLADLRGLQGTVVDITADYDRFAALIEDGDGEGDGESGTGGGGEPKIVSPRPDVVPTLPPVTAALADTLHMPTEALQEIVDLLQSRQQIVLYGPPGTGKTFVAMALAEFVVGTEDGSRARLVQFHPSYAYEDFFEGFRPKETESGQATFELTPGPLRRIASDAEANPGTPYVLVIDELNRANLAKVFGELYFLLEYRNKRIHLQYNPGELFRLPKNLFLIGTMNTADRSIALLDAAMRRRFSFVELHPDEPPVRGVLATWLAAQGHDDERARLLAALNEAIEEQDRDLRIGPSYLMRAEAATPAGLERVWKYDIMPLLEEHYYGRLSRAQIQDRFGLAALRRTLAGGAEPEDEELPEDDFA
jgi:5-methylcytosine-specific restriction protein B